MYTPVVFGKIRSVACHLPAAYRKRSVAKLPEPLAESIADDTWMIEADEAVSLDEPDNSNKSERLQTAIG